MQKNLKRTSNVKNNAYLRITRNVLQVSWFNNAYLHEYALLLYMRVVGLVSRCLIHIRVNTYYFRLMYSCRARGTTRCCLVTPRPRPPLV